MQRVPQKQSALLSRNLRRWRAGAGLTQEALAEKPDITTRYLQQLEAAEFGASLAVLIRLRRALACRWDSLLDGIE
jgi:transcriptional regulator with XRE-family HTH domain